MKTAIQNLYCLGRSYLGRNLSYLIFFVTAKCDARCKMCFYWRQIESSRDRRMLTTEEIELIASHIRYLASLSISGGEPTLRDDLDEIVRSFYKHSGTRFVTFSTNGLDPARVENAAAKILGECPGINLKIYVSIDNLGNKHDEIRSVKGSFDKAIQTIARIKRLKRNNKNVAVFVETVLSAYNKSDIPGIIDFVNNEVCPDSHSISLARGNTREDGARAVTLDEYENAMRLMVKAREHKKDLQSILLSLMMEVNLKTLRSSSMVLPCTAGKRTLTIFDEGSVAPCEMLPQTFPQKDFIMGNLRDAGYDIRKIIGSPKAKQIVDFIKRTECHCSFECATLCNIVFNPKTYPEILKRSIV